MELCKFFNSKVSVNNNNNNNNNDNNSNNNNNNKEDLKTYWKLTTLFLSFSKILPQRGGNVVDFRYLNAETTDETFQQSGNEDYFRDIFQSSVLYHLRFVLERKASKEIPELSRLGILESFQQLILLYQMQKAAHQKYYIEEVFWIHFCLEHL